MNDPRVSPELSARITAATAARADFHKAVDAYLGDPGAGAVRPDFQNWAFRLSSELASVLAGLDVQVTA